MIDRRSATEGWPTGEHNPLLVEGRIEQHGKLAWGLKHNEYGRRRALRMLVLLAVVLTAIVAGTIIYGLVTS